jgi:hypothetical protein
VNILGNSCFALIVRKAMARTIIYRTRSSKPASASAGPFPPAAPTPSPSKTGAPADPSLSDDYTNKLVKYVPAEVLAFFAPTAAAVTNRHGLLIAATVIGFLATPVYLWLMAQRLRPEQKPLPHFYPLSAIAFLAWALGTSSIGSLIGLDSVETAFTLGSSVFLIPLVDGVLERMGK